MAITKAAHPGGPIHADYAAVVGGAVGSSIGMNVCTISPSQPPTGRAVWAVPVSASWHATRRERGDVDQLSLREGKGGWAPAQEQVSCSSLGQCVIKRARHPTFGCWVHGAALGLCCECARACSTFAGPQRLVWCTQGCHPCEFVCSASSRSQMHACMHACIHSTRESAVERVPSRFLHMFMYVILLMPHAAGGAQQQNRNCPQGTLWLWI